MLPTLKAFITGFDVSSSAQIPLDIAHPQRTLEEPVAPTRYLTRAEAARYLRCSLRFLDGMELPFIRKGRCKLYDRVDLDERMQHDK